MKIYRLHELHDQEFEQLTIQICMKILGTGTFSFALGKDGGRDGRFEGTARWFPSSASPRKGKFIIQAKHTTNPGASCSDSEFNQILNKELPRIAALIAKGELEHYLLFTNRKLSGTKDEKSRKSLRGVPNIKTAEIIARETINSYLVANHHIWRDLGFDRNETPFRINPADLAAVIQGFRRTLKGKFTQYKSATNFTHVKKTKKNKLNKLTDDYYSYMQRESLPHFHRLKQFLEDPRNEDLRETYHDAADEFRGKIITFRERFETFDEVLTYLYDEIVTGIASLPGQKRLVRIFLHYMYFDCDIGNHA